MNFFWPESSKTFAHFLFLKLVVDTEKPPVFFHNLPALSINPSFTYTTHLVKISVISFIKHIFPRHSFIRNFYLVGHSLRVVAILLE